MNALISRFMKRSNFGGARGINISPDGSDMNICISLILNSLQIIVEFITRLKVRLINGLDNNFGNEDNSCLNSSDKDMHYSAICDLETVNTRIFGGILRDTILTITDT